MQRHHRQVDIVIILYKQERVLTAISIYKPS